METNVHNMTWHVHNTYVACKKCWCGMYTMLTWHVWNVDMASVENDTWECTKWHMAVELEIYVWMHLLMWHMLDGWISPHGSDVVNPPNDKGIQQNVNYNWERMGFEPKNS